METVQRLPDNVTMDEAMERLYLICKIEIGLQQVADGDLVNHEEFKKEMLENQVAGK